MRDEWTNENDKNNKRTTVKDGFADSSDSRSSQGLTRVGRQTESSAPGRGGGLDRSASLTLAHRGMRLKNKGLADLKSREVSERRQVGDAEAVLNQPNSMDEKGVRWWRNVGMEEGL